MVNIKSIETDMRRKYLEKKKDFWYDSSNVSILDGINMKGIYTTDCLIDYLVD